MSMFPRIVGGMRGPVARRLPFPRFASSIRSFSPKGADHTPDHRASSTVDITLNGRQLSVPEGITLLEAARLNDVDIPALCHHPALKPVGRCRLCLVDVGKPKLVPACTTEVTPGMNIMSHTDEIESEVRSVLSMLRARHPMECATCSANGNCEFQDLLLRYQIEDSRFLGHWERGQTDSSHLHDYSSKALVMDLDKCVLCTRCIRACRELQGMNILGMVKRGASESVAPMMNKNLADTPCISCGACAWVCPVGAIRPRSAVFDVMHLLEGSYSHKDLTWDEKVHMGGPMEVHRELQSVRAQAANRAAQHGAATPDSDNTNKHGQPESEDKPRRCDRPVTVVHTAPAVRVTLSEAFGMEPGTVSTGKMVAALRRLGFDYVFDTNFTADVTIMEEGNELLQRVKNGGPFPLMTSCCPGWINMLEKTYPELIDLVSSSKSPQQMMGALAKSYFAQRMNIDPRDLRVVSLMPCTAKKDEAARDNMRTVLKSSPDVDYVLTTRELASLIRMHRPRIHFNNLEEEEFDSVLGESTGAATIFGVTGGVMEAALRTCAAVLEPESSKTMPRLQFEQVRGLSGVKQATVNLGGQELRVAIAHGGVNLHKVCRMIRDAQKRGEEPPFHFVEMMACRGGCIGGGGNPKDAFTTDLLERRTRAVYSIDEAKRIRRSDQNPDVQVLYDSFLEHPLSEKAEELLHTFYVARNQEFLGRPHMEFEEETPY